MHALLILFSLLMGLVGSLSCKWLLGKARSWPARRFVALAGLVLPVLSAAIMAVVTLHFLFHVCFAIAPAADRVLTLTLTTAAALGIISAVSLNALRAVLLPWHSLRRTLDAPDWLCRQVADLARSSGVRRPVEVRIGADARPWAFVVGPLRPRLVLSVGLLGLLDEEELEAVLDHELKHLRRGDLGWAALASVLHDLSWFLPSTRQTYELLRREQELACDDDVRGTDRRLALASALARVWHFSFCPAATPGRALALLPTWSLDDLELRVERLLDRPRAAMPAEPGRVSFAIAAIVGLVLVVQVAGTTLALAIMGCDLLQMAGMPPGMH